jgi:hypothetical protein
MKKHLPDSTPPERRTDNVPRLPRDYDVAAVRKILELFGQLTWDETYDYKAMRDRDRKLSALETDCHGPQQQVMATEG